MSFEDRVSKILFDFKVEHKDFSETNDALLAAHEAEVERIIGEDYIFTRVKDSYLPNVYIHLKAKNELRAEQRQRAGITQPESTGGE